MSKITALRDSFNSGVVRCLNFRQHEHVSSEYNRFYCFGIDIEPRNPYCIMSCMNCFYSVCAVVVFTVLPALAQDEVIPKPGKMIPIEGPVLLAVHSENVYDTGGETGAALDSLVKEFKQSGDKVIFLSDSNDIKNPLRAWVGKNKDADLILYSNGGENNVLPLSNEITIVGGYAEECMSVAFTNIICNHFSHSHQPLKINLPSDAIFTNHGHQISPALQTTPPDVLQKLYDSDVNSQDWSNAVPGAETAYKRSLFGSSGATPLAEFETENGPNSGLSEVISGFDRGVTNCSQKTIAQIKFDNYVDGKPVGPNQGGPNTVQLYYWSPGKFHLSNSRAIASTVQAQVASVVSKLSTKIEPQPEMGSCLK